MAEPIYLHWKNQLKEAYYQLSEEDRNSHWAKVMEAHEKVDAKVIVILNLYWSTEQWQLAGVTEFPDIESLQKYGELLKEIEHERYVVVDVTLGTKWQE